MDMLSINARGKSTYSEKKEILNQQKENTIYVKLAFPENAHVL